jgi:hypothetical protein
LLLTIYFNQAQIPGYYLFAFQGRAQAKAILESRTVDQITELNDATRNLVASLQAQIVSLDNSFASYRRASEEKLIALEQSNQLVVQQLQLLPGQIGLDWQEQAMLTHHHHLLSLLLLLLESPALIFQESSKNLVTPF